MYPNLLGQKAARKMNDDDMAKVIGVTRPTFRKKLEKNSFTVDESKKFCRFFGKDFDYLFDEAGDSYFTAGGKK